MKGLFVTKEGFVAEGVTSNVFWMKDGNYSHQQLKREFYLEQHVHLLWRLAEFGIIVHEGFYRKEDVENADELFVTNAVQELVPIARIGESSLPGASGVYYKKLHNLYKEAIKEMKEGRNNGISKHKWHLSFWRGEIDFQKETVVMGIFNVTPDSFSDGGKYRRIEAALEHAEEMIRDGAKIIDIGGESTRPGHAPVSLDEELERIVPIIEAITSKLKCAVSIDTYKAGVAEAAMKAGAHIINDVWGAKREPKIAEVAAKYDAPIILMHNREVAEYKGD